MSTLVFLTINYPCVRQNLKIDDVSSLKIYDATTARSDVGKAKIQDDIADRHDVRGNSPVHRNSYSDIVMF